MNTHKRVHTQRHRDTHTWPAEPPMKVAMGENWPLHTLDRRDKSVPSTVGSGDGCVLLIFSASATTEAASSAWLCTRVFVRGKEREREIGQHTPFISFLLSSSFPTPPFPNLFRFLLSPSISLSFSLFPSPSSLSLSLSVHHTFVPSLGPSPSLLQKFVYSTPSKMDLRRGF